MNILGSEWESYGWTSLQYGCYMDHVLWEGLYAVRVRTNWCFGTKDQTRVTSCKHFFHGKCIEIHVGYEKETREINRCDDE